MRRMAAFFALSLGAQVPYWSEFQRHEHPVQLAAQARQESGFNPLASSPVGAMGLCQFMPGTWRDSIKRGWIPPGASPWDAPACIQAQAGYMGSLLGRFRGDWPKSWAGYNWGEGNVERVVKRTAARGITDTPERRAWLDVAPQETQGYVMKIEGIHIPWVLHRVGVAAPTAWGPGGSGPSGSVGGAR